MKHYDNACAKYYTNLNIKCLPLTSWEFRKEHFSDAVLYKKMQLQWNTKHDYFKQAQQQNKEVIITDTNFRIVYATNTISRISGYQHNEIVGKSPSIFQGIDTCVKTREKIKTALHQLKPFKEVVLNYKKNGDSYWCEIEAYPLFDKNGGFVNYIALEKIAS